MWTRVAAGVPAALVLIGITYWAPVYVILGISVLCASFAYIEFSHLLLEPIPLYRQGLNFVLLAAMILAVQQGSEAPWNLFLISAIIFSLLRVASASDHKNLKNEVSQLALELLGLFYVLCLFGFIAPIAEVGNRGRHYLLLFFLTCFMSDTTAYFVGSKWGKKRLAPTVSPNKSIQGAFAGIIASLLVRGIWVVCVDKGERGTSYFLAILLWGFIGSVLGQLGDLFESMLKRACAQKDSGSFLPGHGGILDRIDCFFFAGPIFYLFLVYFLENP